MLSLKQVFSTEGSMKQRLFILLQHLIPQHAASRLLGRIANSRNHWLKDKLIQLCIRHYKIDMSIVAEQNLETYPTFNSFFIRRLSAEARPIDANPASVVSPADGVISQLGAIHGQHIFQAKGREYSLDQLLVHDEALVKAFSNGQFATTYLSPRDYHRVHMPITGKLVKAIYVPGKLFSVNPTTVDNVECVFARNERLIAVFETVVGPMAVILVGALFVAGIHTVWQGKITPNNLRNAPTWDYTNESIVLEKGAELGHFEFGSTTIVLFPENTMQWHNSVQAGSFLKMGQTMGDLI